MLYNICVYMVYKIYDPVCQNEVKYGYLLLNRFVVCAPKDGFTPFGTQEKTTAQFHWKI